MSGCSMTGQTTQPETIVRTEYKTIDPPKQLLEPCAQPEINGNTLEDYVVYSVKATSAIKVCNYKLEALRYIYQQRGDI